MVGIVGRSGRAWDGVFAKATAGDLIVKNVKNESSSCFWCGSPSKMAAIVGDKRFCGALCQRDYTANEWPSWMTGRIGPEPNKSWHMTGEFLCLAAPNRFRQMFRKRGEQQTAIIERQRTEFPWLPEPLGIGIDYPSWDQVLIWAGSTVTDATGGQKL